MSTGQPASSKIPSPNPANQPLDELDAVDFILASVDATELCDHPAPPNTPQVHDFATVKSRSAFEHEVLTALEEEFSRLDDVARAAARFERQTLEHMKKQRLAEGYTDDDAGDLKSPFDVDDFTARVAGLVEISTLSRVVGMLGLGTYRDEIVRRMISQKFTTAEDKPKEVKAVYLGSHEQAMLRELRAAKENK
jgi:crotonobetainyl-CoA:carnitine CoA-transferase CaiB-like acyl-CoA transferase